MKRKVATKAEKTQPVSAKPTTHLSLVLLLQHIVKYFLGSQQLQVSMLGLRNWAPDQFSLDFNLRCFCSLDRTLFQILT